MAATETLESLLPDTFPDATEVAVNPRARSAKLRVASRLDAPAAPVDPRALGLPDLALERLA